MNAYELADKLETDKWDEATIVSSINDGIKMLRQQADKLNKYELRNQEQIKRIAELEKLNAELKEYNTEMNEKEHNFEMKLYLLEKDNKQLHAIAQRMAMAESDARKSLQSYKDAKNEPVAWIACDADLPLKEDGSYWLYPDSSSEWKNLYIPLYTTPQHASDVKQTKPLSDEEIMEISGGENLTEQVFFWDSKTILALLGQ